MPIYEVPDSPKMLRETLCVAQTRIGASPLDESRKAEHIARLQRLIDACDAHRPLGPDGKHGDRHTPTCGCGVRGQVFRTSLDDFITREQAAGHPVRVEGGPRG